MGADLADFSFVTRQSASFIDDCAMLEDNNRLWLASDVVKLYTPARKRVMSEIFPQRSLFNRRAILRCQPDSS